MNGNYRKNIVLVYSISCIYVYVNIYVYIINTYDINIVPYICLVKSLPPNHI